MEQEATDRDQVLYACAAQEPKMLPKKQTPKSNGAEQLRHAVEKHVNSPSRQT